MCLLIRTGLLVVRLLYNPKCSSFCPSVRSGMRKMWISRPLIKIDSRIFFRLFFIPISIKYISYLVRQSISNALMVIWFLIEIINLSPYPYSISIFLSFFLFLFLHFFLFFLSFSITFLQSLSLSLYFFSYCPLSEIIITTTLLHKVNKIVLVILLPFSNKIDISQGYKGIR